MPQVHRKVKLLACTPHPEQTVSMAAKLCYSSSDLDDLENTESTAAFLRRLTDMGHLSPIEHASFTFGIEGVSRAMLAQITRHRIASFSVQSQRYVNQMRDGGGFCYVIPPAIEALGENAVLKYKEQMRTMQEWYSQWVQQLGGSGEKSNEDARFVLPNACETKMIVTMNARELLHFFSLRCCNRAQWEIRDVAWDMLGLVLQQAPDLFAHAGPACLYGTCSEGKMSCGQADRVKACKAALVKETANG